MKTSSIFYKWLIAAFVISSCFQTILYSQHCCPICESYLGNISVAHYEDSLKINIQYCKLGGNPHGTAYQFYLIGYLAKNESKLLALDRENITIYKHSIVLQNKVIGADDNAVENSKIKESGISFNHYSYQFRDTIVFEINDLAKKIISSFEINGDSDSTVIGGWGSYNEKFKIAVFIPLLDDVINSTSNLLPEDKHECNYANLPYLLFQPLPYTFEIKFGTVMGRAFAKGKYYIHINYQ
ncbi:MAG: hypothetical protein V1720_00025 [bacterium]